MREFRTSGSVGSQGWQRPWLTRYEVESKHAECVFLTGHGDARRPQVPGRSSRRASTVVEVGETADTTSFRRGEYRASLRSQGVSVVRRPSPTRIEHRWPSPPPPTGLAMGGRPGSAGGFVVRIPPHAHRSSAASA